MSRIAMHFVCGSRDYPEVGRQLLDHWLDKWAAEAHKEAHLMVLHGVAHGPDKWAGEWARRMGVQVVEMPAMWKTHGRRAGHRRNAHMAALLAPMLRDPRAFNDVHATALWNGESRGTRGMLENLERLGLQVRVLGLPCCHKDIDGDGHCPDHPKPPDINVYRRTGDEQVEISFGHTTPPTTTVTTDEDGNILDIQQDDP